MKMIFFIVERIMQLLVATIGKIIWLLKKNGIFRNSGLNFGVVIFFYNLASVSICVQRVRESISFVDLVEGLPDFLALLFLSTLLLCPDDAFFYAAYFLFEQDRPVIAVNNVHFPDDVMFEEILGAVINV